MLVSLVLVLALANAIIKYQVTVSYQSAGDMATLSYFRSIAGVSSGTCVIIIQH